MTSAGPSSASRVPRSRLTSSGRISSSLKTGMTIEYVTAPMAVLLPARRLAAADRSERLVARMWLFWLTAREHDNPGAPAPGTPAPAGLSEHMRRCERGAHAGSAPVARCPRAHLRGEAEVDVGEIQNLVSVEDRHWWHRERRAILARELRRLPGPGRALDIGAAGGGTRGVLGETGWRALAVTSCRKAQRSPGAAASRRCARMPGSCRSGRGPVTLGPRSTSSSTSPRTTW